MKLKTGYLLSGILTGIVLLFSAIGTIPDGKLHMTFCNVGQGDGAYIRFPDGRDMVVDGGPNNAIVDCLSRVMPFWDRTIDMVLMTHPQKDHFQGLLQVFARYNVRYFVRSNVKNSSDGYQDLMRRISDKKIQQKFLSRGETITVGVTTLRFLWPSTEQLAKMECEQCDIAGAGTQNVLGAKSSADLNDGSLVFLLRYGNFDALFTGDADTRVEAGYIGDRLADETLELLKVPHHGSKTGMNQAFVDWLHPKLAVISVGKNTYGHPSAEALHMLQTIGSRILRTDQGGNIEVVSDGKGWKVE